MAIPMSSEGFELRTGLVRGTDNEFIAGSIYARGSAGTIFITIPTTGTFFSVKEIMFSADIQASEAGPKIEFYRSDAATPLVASSFTGSLWFHPTVDDGTNYLSAGVVNLGNQTPVAAALKARVTFPGAGSVYITTKIDYTTGTR